MAFAEPVCEELRTILLAAANESGAKAHDRGTYVNMEGPAFSTRAESLRNQKLGFDVIGMTNMGEARCAREAEISYATLAMVTDYDCWKVEEEPVSVETPSLPVLKRMFPLQKQSSEMQSQRFQTPRLAKPQSTGQCYNDREKRLAKRYAIENLKPIIGRFL